MSTLSQLLPAETFWRQELKGFRAPTPLVVDQANRTVHSRDSNPAEAEVRLSETVTLALKSLTQDHELTLNTLVKGAWALLLSRYSSEEDVIFGVARDCHQSTVANESIEKRLTILLPTRVRISPDQLLLPWLKQLQAQWTTLQEYKRSSLAQVQEWSDISSDTALFESLLVFEDYQINSAWENRGSQPLEQTNFPLIVTSHDGPELILNIKYNCQRFDPAAVTRMLGHLQTLLAGMATNLNQRLLDLPLLTNKEQDQLSEWNDTQQDYPQDIGIHQLFEAQVERTPDAVAVIFADQQLTYQQLNCCANQLAHYLQALGVGPEVLVGICIERSLEMVVGLLGILKAGGAYVPLDPAYPQERLGFMLQDSQVLVLLTQQHLATGLPEHQAHIVCLDTDGKVIAQESQENPISSVKAENLAYVIYTSGSTGKPKGVAMKQLPLVNLILWQLDNTTVPSSARTLQFAPVSFDVSFQETFSTWCSGGALVLLSESVRRDLRALLRLLADAQIERLFLPFVALQQLAEVAVAAKLMPTSLREIITAGEQLQTTPPIVNLFTKLAGCVLHNHYGPSESHVVTSFTLTGSATSWPALPPIGRPIANTQIHLLDQFLHPVPIGVSGELHIGGVCLARGYINRADLTKERFIPNPFSNDPEARLYKTGDLARYLPTGDIEYLGRIDNQVKIRGFRIELGEIETALAQHPAAQQVAVIAREDHPGDKRLVAYVVPNQGQAPTAKELRHFLKGKLPDYMVPSTYVILDTLPLTPSGKLDRRALPAPDQTRSELEETFVAAQNQVELQLTKIWEDVLGILPIGIRDNFFELGGHSLLAARLFTEIERSFGKNLPLATLFQAATIEQLAIILRQEDWSAPWSSLVTIQASGSQPPLFCIHGGGFNLLVYRDLANYLGPNQPVYGLQAQGLDGETVIHRRFEDMAADYIKHIQTVQPKGPYLLAGLSSGGIIALEMAQQLRAQGQKVALLAMFDTHGPDNFLKVLPPTPRLLSVLRYALRYTFPRFIGKRLQLGPKAILTSVLKEVRTASQWVRDDRKSQETAMQLEAVGMTTSTADLAQNSMSYLEQQIHAFNMWIVERSELAYLAPQAKVHGLGGTLSDAVQKLEAAHIQAELSYVPQVYLDQITLFRAQEQLPGFYRDPKHGWGRIAAGGLEIYDVPGYHVDVVKSPVIAEKMRACINKALAK